MLGHASPETTRRYVQVPSDAMRRMVENVSRRRTERTSALTAEPTATTRDPRNGCASGPADRCPVVAATSSLSSRQGPTSVRWYMTTATGLTSTCSSSSPRSGPAGVGWMSGGQRAAWELARSMVEGELYDNFWRLDGQRSTALLAALGRNHY